MALTSNEALKHCIDVGSDSIYDWFLLQGSSLDLLFDNEEDALQYKNFVYALLDNDNGDVLEALKEVGLY